MKLYRLADLSLVWVQHKSTSRISRSSDSAGSNVTLSYLSDRNSWGA